MQCLEDNLGCRRLPLSLVRQQIGKSGVGTSKHMFLCVRLLRFKDLIVQRPQTPITDEDLVMTLDTGGRDEEATRKTLIFSRKLRYLLANLTTDTARLIVRQNADSNGLETWRRLFRKFAPPDATRHVSLLTQLLDFKFNPATCEQDFLTWETIKVKYERQTGTELPIAF